MILINEIIDISGEICYINYLGELVPEKAGELS